MRYFEDFVPGLTLQFGAHLMTRERILEFAREFDPQPFHIDENAAAKSMYGGLIASGWHTCAAYMRMLVEGVVGDSSSMGSGGMDELRWKRPVRAGDVLSVRYQVLSVKPSEKHADRGTVFGFSEVLNQDGEVVMTLENTGIFGRRPK